MSVHFVAGGEIDELQNGSGKKYECEFCSPIDMYIP